MNNTRIIQGTGVIRLWDPGRYGRDTSSYRGLYFTLRSRVFGAKLASTAEVVSVIASENLLQNASVWLMIKAFPI